MTSVWPGWQARHNTWDRKQLMVANILAKRAINRALISIGP
jgi:hypothetical protein